jgi:hypothetical protein
MTDKEALKLALEALERTQNEGYNLPGIAIREAITAIKEALKDPMRKVQRLGQKIEQEPVAWVNKERNTITWDKLYPDMDALYTHPPQRKPLTTQKIIEIRKALKERGQQFDIVNDFARAIEAAHGIKENT